MRIVSADETFYGTDMNLLMVWSYYRIAPAVRRRRGTLNLLESGFNGCLLASLPLLLSVAFEKDFRARA